MEMSRATQRLLASLIEARTGQQLGLDRRWRIDSALHGLMRDRGFINVDQLVARLVSGRDDSLAEAVIEALLNNETYFFRDRLPFDLLLDGPLRRLEAARASARKLAVWCAGCSTGQEAYSLAMSFAEEPDRWRGWKIEIVGTDLSARSIEQAKAGLYSQFEVQRGLPVGQMLKWFEALGGQWRVSPELRRMIRFEVAHIGDVPPRPGRFDIILCRNVMLYFSPDMKRRAFNRLASAIAPDGYLMLGAGETVIGQTESFASDPEFRGLYIPAATAAVRPAVAQVA
jgi:chemotaxis protein methyltransferase CheR